MEAEKSAKQALKIFPDSRDAYENLAKSMRDQQKFELAEQYFQKAIEIQPIFTPTYNLVAMMRFFSGDLIGTIDIANKGIALQEDYTDLIYLKACSYHGLGQFKDAIEGYKKVMKIDKKHWAFYHIDLAKFHQNTFDEPLSSWNLDRHFLSDFKERWGKREPSYTLKYYIKQPDLSPKALSLKLGQPLTPQLQKIFDAASLFKSKIQYTSPGFYKNEKQHRQAGIATIHMAQAAQSYWNAYRNGQTIPLSGQANSNGNAEAVPHDFGWRDFYDITVNWRQMSEPSDPVWWIDMLCEDTFAEGYGAHTPLLMGEARVVRYYQYHDRIIALMRDLMPQQYSLAGEQKSACFEAKACDDLYQLQRKDFYVHTNCRRLTDKTAKPLEGTRLTIQRDKNGYVLSIRTPCTPERWRMFDVEMELAWQNLAETMRGPSDQNQIVKDILVVAFYWYNFMPLVRGSAACGLVSIHALLLAAGFEIKRDIPSRLQIDWEAILNPDPESFIECIKPWFDSFVTPVENGFLESVPNVEQSVDTLRKAFQLLNNGFVIH